MNGFHTTGIIVALLGVVGFLAGLKWLGWPSATVAGLFILYGTVLEKRKG